MATKLFLTTLSAVCLLLTTAHIEKAQAVTWQVGTGNWSTGGNWNGGEPTAGDAAQIGNGGTAQITTAGEVAASVDVGHSSTNPGNGTLEISAGDLTVTGDMFLGAAGSRARQLPPGQHRRRHRHVQSPSGNALRRRRVHPGRESEQQRNVQSVAGCIFAAQRRERRF